MSALSTSSLYLVLRARDEASRVIRGFTATLTEADVAAAKIQAAQIRRGQAMATIGVAVAVAGVIGVAALDKMTNAAIDYNNQVALTMTQVDGLKISMDQLGKIGLNVAQKLPVEFAKIQPTLYDIFSSIDVNAPQAADLLMNIGKASVAGQADMQTVGRATISILNAYKMKTSEVSSVNDVMFQLVRKGVGTYQEFTNVIGRVIPSSIKAGQTFQTTAGMIAFMTRNGMSAAMAATATARSFDTLSKPQVIKSLQDLGISIMDAQGKFRPMIDIVHELQGKLKGLPPVVQAVELNKVFKGAGANMQTMRFFNLALHDSTDLLGSMTTSMNSASGASDAAYKIMANTPAAKVTLLKNAYHTMAIDMGNTLLPAKKLLLDMLIKLVTWFTNLSPWIRTTITVFIALASIIAIVTGVMIALAGVMVIVSSSMAVLAPVIAVVSGLMETLGIVALYAADTMVGAWLAAALPVTAVIAGIALLVLGFRVLWNHVYMFRVIIVDAMEIAVKVVGYLVGAFGKLLTIIFDIVTGPIKLFLEALSHLPGVGKFARDGLNAISAGVKDVGNMFDSAAISVGKFGDSLNSLKNPSSSGGVSMGRKLGVHIGTKYNATGQLTNAANGVDDFQKMLDALLNPSKKAKTAKVAPGNNPIVSALQEHINNLKALIKTGASDIAKMAGDVPAAAAIVQKAITKLSQETPNQLKALGVGGIQKLIDGLKSKEAALVQAYDDVLYKTALAAYLKAQDLAARGADAINGFIAKMTGDLGKDITTLKPITLSLGSDVVDAFATGMAQESPKARLQAYTALVGAVENAYQGVLTQLEAVRQAVVDKMKTISDAISQSIMSVVSFSTAYTKAMDIAKTASDALAAQNKVALAKVDEDYKVALGNLDTTLKNAQGILTQTAQNISNAITGAMSFSNAASQANLQENTFMEQLKVQADKAKAFAAQIKTLLTMGLSGDAINQVAAAGADAGATIAQNIIDGGTSAIKDTNDMVKSVTDLANSLGTTTADSYYKAGVTQAQAIYDGYVATMGPNSPGYLKMVADADAAVTAMASTLGETFAQALAGQNKIASAFSAQINQLVSMGLSPEALQQVLAAGTDAGSQIAASLISGGATAIKQTNDLLNATQTMADKIGTDAATHYYGAGLASADAMIQAFIDNFGPKGKGRATLMSAMDDLAKSMNRTATVTINTVNPGLLSSTRTPSTPSIKSKTSKPSSNTVMGGPKDLSNYANSPDPSQVHINIPVTNVQTQDPQAYAAALGFYLAGKLIQ